MVQKNKGDKKLKEYSHAITKVNGIFDGEIEKSAEIMRRFINLKSLNEQEIIKVTELKNEKYSQLESIKHFLKINNDEAIHSQDVINFLLA